MTVLLVDGHQLLRDGLRAVLEREPDLRVVGEASDGRAAVEACETLHPAIVLMDVVMPGLNGVDATRQIAARHPASRVVALSMNCDRRNVQAMLDAGARGYLLKSASAGELIRAIRVVAGDERYVSPAVGFVARPGLSNEAGGGEAEVLTPREREVVQLLAEGLTSKEIATRLAVAVSTVESHRKQVMAKLGLHTVAELTKFAIRAGLSSLD